MRKMLPLVLVAVGMGACSPGEPATSRLGRLRLPTGMALAPEGHQLFITNGNWDEADDASTLVLLDADRLAAGLATPAAPGAGLTRDRPCRRIRSDPRIECDPGRLIDSSQSVRLGSGAGNVEVDFPKDVDTAFRLLVPTRIEPGVTWMDVVLDASGHPLVECGQGSDRRCDAAHTLEGIEDEPAMLRVDREGHRFAYLPHLLGRQLTLIALDGEFGPELAHEDEEFFREDTLHGSGLGGGFAVAQRPCDLETDNVPTQTQGCERPLLYTTHRFWWGLRSFRVAPGPDTIVRGGNISVIGTSVTQAQPRPIMGDLAFEDPAVGDRLVVVHTTPPGLSRLDTSLSSSGGPRNNLLDSVSVCNNPNMVEVYRPADGPGFAFVTCFGADELAAVELTTFSVSATIHLGNGPNEMVVDEARRLLYVTNTLEHTISVVDLRTDSDRYMRELAVIGLEHAPRGE